MPRLLRIVGTLLLVIGTVWILQGLGVLTAGDSFMVGQTEWTVIGGIAAVVGIGLIALSRRRAVP